MFATARAQLKPGWPKGVTIAAAIMAGIIVLQLARRKNAPAAV
jgi:hypothetical protein